MELSVKDRIVLLSVLPREGNLTTIRQLRELREALSFTDEEHECYGMREIEDRIFWDSEGTKDVPISPRMLTLIADEFRRLDERGKFRDEMLDTYEKFERADA